MAEQIDHVLNLYSNIAWRAGCSSSALHMIVSLLDHYTIWGAVGAASTLAFAA